MVAVAFYSLGEIDANITDLERNIASLRSPVSALAAPDSSALPAAGQGAPDVTVPGSRAFGGATAETVLARFHSLYETYKKWMWVEFTLGAFILLAGAIKQAAWRHSWVTQRESRRLGLEPEKDERAKASDGS